MTGSVLVAEDDTEMLRLIQGVLRRRGYHVYGARNGSELMRFVDTGRLRGEPITVDVLVSDIRMPGYSGLDVLAKLRSADWTTPVVLLTGFGDAAAHWEAKRLGAVALLDKPFELDDLVKAIESVVLPTF